MRRLVFPAVLIITLLFCLFGCLDDVEEIALDIPEGEINAPAGLAADAGDELILIRWEILPGVLSYNVYRRTGAFGEMRLVVNTADTFYMDEDVRNGQDYFYTVAGVVNNGFEGRRADEIHAMPSVYSIMINGGARFTNTTDVVLSITAPVSSVLMLISNVPELTGAEWEIFSNYRDWELETSDGVKTVYAMLQNDDGSNSSIVANTIILDTYSAATVVGFTPDIEKHMIGSAVHFVIETDGNEVGGEAFVELEGYSETITLYDDGRGGDQFPSDGSYEADFTFPTSLRGMDIGVAGRFIDQAGNLSPMVESVQTISFSDPPDAVQFLGAIDSTTSSITIKWVESTEPNFHAYRIFRNTAPGVTDLPEYFVRGLDNRAQTSYPDGELTEGATYYYRIFVVNDLDDAAGSNEVSLSTYDGYPDEVTLDPVSAVGIDRLTLTWSINVNTDFLEYRIYRSTTPGVTVDSELVTTPAIDDREVIFFDDAGLDLAGNTYYYRVFVYDIGGKNSRSNEVSTLE